MEVPEKVNKQRCFIFAKVPYSRLGKPKFKGHNAIFDKAQYLYSLLSHSHFEFT